MKRSLFAIIISLVSIYLAAQEKPLNQMELLKQFQGEWECRLGTGTVMNYEYIIVGGGMAGSILVKAGGGVVDSAVQLYGYDTEKDAVIYAELVNSSPELEIKTLRFATATTGDIISSGKNSGTKIAFEFQEPGVMKQVADLGKGYIIEMHFVRKEKW